MAGTFPKIVHQYFSIIQPDEKGEYLLAVKAAHVNSVAYDCEIDIIIVDAFNGTFRYLGDILNPFFPLMVS